MEKNNGIYKIADQNPIKFWEDLAKEGIVWKKLWKKAFVHKPPYFRAKRENKVPRSKATSGPYFKWFVGGELNITENCLDRHLPEKENKIALIWEPEPINEKIRTYTYKELFSETCKLANALKKLGVRKGDRVGIYLPMVPEIVVAMLACARLGAVHSVVFSAFSPAALRLRLQDTKAEILITADGYFRRGQVVNLKTNADEGIKDTKIKKTVVVKRTGNEINWNPKKDLWYHDLTKNQKDNCPATAMDAEDPFFILYTSGSTGKPKGILHTCGGYAVQTLWTGKWIFDFRENDIFWCTSDPGWITGHTYTIYSPLLNGITTLMFEGAPDWPAPDRWAQIIEKHKITIFYTAPTAIRMFQKYGEAQIKEENLSSLRLLGSVGEPIDEAAWQWYFKNVGGSRCEIVDTWWQTETGGILISSLPGIGPIKPAFAGLPFPGIKIDILDPEGKSCPPNTKGDLVILPPFAPGMLRGIYKNHKKYLETYWSQHGKNTYFTSDAALKDENGMVRILGRVDDVLKIAGHRLATGELENAVNNHAFIGECAVVGVPDPIKGEAIVVFAVRERGPFFDAADAKGKPNPDESELKQAVIDQIKKEIGPFALPKLVFIVEDLPKTRSGKIMRRILKKLFTNEDPGDLSTLANPEIVEKISKLVSLTK
ncbi:MAG: acetate--CoA ligase [bacterium]|nr:acetate--CoA ligase [bacterium]